MAKYLTNNQILPVIHQNKAQWCNAPEFHDYHVIPTHQILVACRRTGEMVKRPSPLDESALTPSVWKELAESAGVDPDDLIVRVMTASHIPPESLAIARRLFRPYKHYMMVEDQLVEVCRSHWVGSAELGHYSISHARPTPEIAKMWFDLTNRIASKGNFRGYGYIDDMTGNALLMISQVGLQFDESRGSNVFSYWTTIIKNQFFQILNKEKKARELRDTLLRSAGIAVDEI